MNHQHLLENHLKFLASHRGELRRQGDTVFVESDRPEFTYAILGQQLGTLDGLRDVNTVQHLPWSGISAEDLLHAQFVPTMGLSYMVLSDVVTPWNSIEELQVKHSQDSAHIDSFSEVQSRGFNESQVDFDRWHPWLRAANVRNQHSNDQLFYVGSLGNEPVGTALVVLDASTAGIYGVATLPAHRKKGISTSIMKQAVVDAKARGCDVVTLQVKQDSYVEEFYRHLGFKRVFTTGMYRRKS